MKVADIMTRGVISLAPEDTLRKAAELMLRYDMSGFPVLDRGKLVGMITQGDFMRRVETGTDRPRPRWIEFFADPGLLAAEYAHTHARTVGEMMTRNVVTVGEDASLAEAVELMERHHVKRLPVVKRGVLIGIVTRVNLLHAFIARTPREQPAPLGDAAIREQLIAELGRQPWISPGSVQVAVEQGVVSLTGTIRDERQRAALRVAAENIPGVKEVVEDLREIDPAVVG